MAVLTFEGIVEAGQIRLLNGEQLPENTSVYIVVPNYPEEEQRNFRVTIPENPRIMSPRLMNKEDAKLFRMEMAEDTHAGI